MAVIHIRRDHALGLEAARSRVEQIARAIQEQLAMEHEWHGNELHLKRSGASATIDVAADTVDLTIRLGLLLSPLKGRLEAAIQDRLDEVLT
jgi:putative polyhydroxyalkanoate system protein